MTILWVLNLILMRFVSCSSFYSSVILPWFTVREVKVDIEIVRLLYFFACTELIVQRNSHHQKWPLFVLNVACSRGSWRELAAVLSSSITRLASYRMLPSFEMPRSILITFLLEKENMLRNIISSAVFKEILLSHSWKIHQPIFGQGSWRYFFFRLHGVTMTVFLPSVCWSF